MKSVTLCLAAIFGGLSLPALAQTTPGAPGTDQVIPEKDRSRPQDQPGNSQQSLSEKLDKSGGVIKPAEDVDPKMTKPAPVPEPNSTPVIPPPGSPGGNPDVKPK
ncbi:MAG: hypothetical protein QOH65_355 [Methylobacteriaceae bacterium]|nr:hypothetical protein [Methylobacteriaceae bacterium]